MEQETQLAITAEKLAAAAETLDRVLTSLDGQQQSLNAKVDRIVAAVEDGLQRDHRSSHDRPTELESRVAELERANTELRAQAARLSRKTLSPLATAVLSKHSDAGERMDPAVLDKTLQALTIEQRIAVKAEMARAGMLE